MTLYSGTQINELDGYQIQSEQGIYEGNLLLIDESFQVYTCFYIQMAEGKAYIFKGKDVAVRPLEKHQYFILYLPKERDSEFLYDCYYGNPDDGSRSFGGRENSTVRYSGKRDCTGGTPADH